MKRCFEILGLGENATKEQIQEAYDRKATRYSSDLYLDDPKYAKKKLKELKQAYTEAYRLAEHTDEAAIDDTLQDFEEKPVVDINEDTEKYMQQLYRKHLGRYFRGMGNVSEKERQRQRYINKYGRSKANKAAIVVTLLVVVIFSVMIGVVSCDFSDLNEAELKPISQYGDDEIRASDREIAAKAEEIYRIYKEQMDQESGVGHKNGIHTKEVPIPDKANQFAKLYWDMDTIGAVSDYLSATYEGYPTDSSDTTVRQLDTIMLFYQFPVFDETRYDVNPYSGVEIWYYSNHIEFLMDAYEHV